MYAAILRIEQNHAKSIQARNFTSGEILGFRMISSLNGFRPKFWTEGDLGISFMVKKRNMVFIGNPYLSW